MQTINIRENQAAIEIPRAGETVKLNIDGANFINFAFTADDVIVEADGANLILKDAANEENGGVIIIENYSEIIANAAEFLLNMADSDPMPGAMYAPLFEDRSSGDSSADFQTAAGAQSPSGGLNALNNDAGDIDGSVDGSTGQDDPARQSSFNSDRDSQAGRPGTDSVDGAGTADDSAATAPTADTGTPTPPVNETPTLTVTPANEQLAFAENSAIDTAVAQAAAVDPENGTVTYTLNDNHGGMFKIDPDSGVISLAQSPDFEALTTDDDGKVKYDLEVTASDGNSTTEISTITVEITDVDETPTLTVTPANEQLTFAENSAIDTAVAQAAAVDPENGTVTYTLNDNHGGMFKIDPDSGVISLAQSPDFEALTTDDDGKVKYNLEVTASDGNSTTEVSTVTVEITDVDEQPTINVLNPGTAETPIALTENNSESSFVAQVAGTDPENASLEYGLKDHHGLFHIDNTGKITLQPNVDYESLEQTKFELVATVTDNETGIVESDTIYVDINDLNEAPSMSMDGQLKISFVSESAGFENMFGIYLADESGTPVGEPQILLRNPNSTTDNTLLKTVPEPAEGQHYEYFIIANGGTRFPNIQDSDLSFNTDNGKLVLVTDGNAIGNTYFSDSANNKDKLDGGDDYVKTKDGQWTNDHFIVTTDEKGTTTLRIEDLSGGGDKDYKDLIIQIEKSDNVQDYKTQFLENDHADSGVDVVPDTFKITDPDGVESGNAVQTAKVAITNAETGDELSFAQKLPDGIIAKDANGNIILVNSDGDVVLAEGNGTIDITEIRFEATPGAHPSAEDFAEAIRSVNFHNDSDTPEAGDRTISIIIADGPNGSASAVNTSTTVTVVQQNDAPLATDDSYNGIAITPGTAAQGDEHAVLNDFSSLKSNPGKTVGNDDIEIELTSGHWGELVETPHGYLGAKTGAFGDSDLAIDGRGHDEKIKISVKDDHGTSEIKIALGTQDSDAAGDNYNWTAYDISDDITVTINYAEHSETIWMSYNKHMITNNTLTLKASPAHGNILSVDLQATDNTDDFSIASVTIADPDYIPAVPATLDMGGNGTGDLLLNDTDLDGDILHITSVNGDPVAGSGSTVINGVHGELTISADGDYSYTLNDGWQNLESTVTETFHYVVDDGSGEANNSDTATLEIPIHVLPADVTGGTDQSDLIVGNNESNNISGLGGNDSIYGYGDGDIIYGDTGVDKIEGGDDILNGGAGNDTIYGGGGNDTIYGATGDDDLDGGAGDDIFIASSGTDYIYTKAGNDQIIIHKDCLDDGPVTINVQKTSQDMFDVDKDVIKYDDDTFDYTIREGGGNQVSTEIVFSDGDTANGAEDIVVKLMGVETAQFDHQSVIQGHDSNDISTMIDDIINNPVTDQ